MKSPYLTVKEVAEIERINLFTVYQKLNEGRIPGAQRIGRFWRINAETYAKKRGLTMEQLAA